MLSKSKYCAFVQCPRNLWLKTYKPELATPDTSIEARKDSAVLEAEAQEQRKREAAADLRKRTLKLKLLLQ